jgi:hypothetical protein
VKRIFHTWDRWECYPAGFYELSVPGKTDDECRGIYHRFLASEQSFVGGLEIVLGNWKNSSEHYLSNERMNRIAWLGQAAACAATGIPAKYRSGYFLLTRDEQKAADLVALRYLNKWLGWRGESSVNLEQAGVNTEGYN